ncbi:MAG: isoaspartyl peptidase/L-asparaginase family protein [Candidatus Methanodesulfokora sp.]
MWAIVIHGGAGQITSTSEREHEVLLEAVKSGAEVLASGGSALDAVEKAVLVMEDSGLFNAGSGSCLNIAGEVEMDAAIMSGGRAGAVACVKRIKNPIKAARKVMELTDHVILSGEFAERFAIKMGLETSNFITEEKMERYRKLMEVFNRKEWYYKLNKDLLDRYPELIHGTVGAVAIDSKRELAAATSTGGVWLKLPGRIGDSAVIGAGTYADERVAISATGIGEYIIKMGFGIRASVMAEMGMKADEIARALIAKTSSEFGRGIAGVIVVDRNYRIGVDYNTAGMRRGWMRSDMKRPVVVDL